MIKAIFDIQYTPMLPTKFQVDWPFGSGEQKIAFQDGCHVGHLGFPIEMIWPSAISYRNYFSFFFIYKSPYTSYQSSSQLAQGCRRSRLLKQLLMSHAGGQMTDKGLTTIAHLEHFVLRWAKRKWWEKRYFNCMLPVQPMLHIQGSGYRATGAK